MLIHVDSFSNQDREPTIHGARYENWNDATSVFSAGIFLAATYGRTTGGLYLLTNSGTNGFDRFIHKNFDNYDTVIVGVACKVDTTTFGVTNGTTDRNVNRQILAFYDGYQAQVSVYMTPSMRLGVRLGQTSTVLGRSSRYIREGTFHYIECAVVFNATTGSVKVRVDGEEWSDLYLSNINTLVSGVAQCNGVRLGNNAQSAHRYFYYDDFYIATPGGPEYNDFVGDIYMKGVLPSANQGAQGWEPTSGTVHFSQVNDTLQSTSTASNVRTSGGGNTDLFQFASIDPTAGTVLAVTPNIYARKDGAGVVRIATVVDNGVTAVRGSEQYLNQNYLYYQPIMTKNPIANTQWPIGTAGTIAFGVVKV